MIKNKKMLVGVACVALVAACGGSADDTDTTVAPTTVDATTATTPADVTTTTADASTTTTAGPTTTAVSPSAGGDLSIIHDAMAKTSEQNPSRIEGVISMVGVDLGNGVPTDVEMPFTVQTDPATGDTAMLMDFGAMAGAMGDSEGMPAEMADLMGSMEVRQIGETVYLKFPFFTAFMGAETEWVSMPAEEGSDFTSGMSGGANPSDPTSFLGNLSDADGTAEELGSEDVRGISTTRYRVVIDEDWQDQLSAEELADLEEQGPLPDTSFPMDLWIDDDGLVHRMAMDVNAEDMAESDEEFESMTMTFDFFDFGKPVAIEAPPADQVTDASELAGLFGTSMP